MDGKSIYHPPPLTHPSFLQLILPVDISGSEGGVIPNFHKVTTIKMNVLISAPNFVHIYQ